MSTECALIEDGFSLDTVIPRVAGLYPRVQVRYRPALAEERNEWRIASPRDFTGRERVQRMAALIAKHLEQWDVKNRAGVEVRSDAATLAKLHPELLDKLLDLVLGYAPAREEEDEKKSSPASAS